LALLWSLAASAVHPAEVKHLNPYTGDADAIAEGRVLYNKNGCAGCHGAGGGGGMGPAILDDKWKFGADDETLFRLVRGEIPQQTMPAVFGKVLTDDEVWKIIAFVRSLYRGDPEGIVWGPPASGGSAPSAPAEPATPAPADTETQ
jgi:cytochrome c(L)